MAGLDAPIADALFAHVARLGRRPLWAAASRVLLLPMAGLDAPIADALFAHVARAHYHMETLRIGARGDTWRLGAVVVAFPFRLGNDDVSLDGLGLFAFHLLQEGCRSEGSGAEEELHCRHVIRITQASVNAASQ